MCAGIHTYVSSVPVVYFISRINIECFLSVNDLSLRLMNTLLEPEHIVTFYGRD
jgi:hypothetical protein